MVAVTFNCCVDKSKPKKRLDVVLNSQEGMWVFVVAGPRRHDDGGGCKDGGGEYVH